MMRRRAATALVEIAPGEFKPIRELTPDEHDAATRIEERKAHLMKRWVELLDELGEDWIPQRPFVVRMGSGNPPALTSVAVWEAEVRSLEAVRDLRAQAIGSVN